MNSIVSGQDIKNEIKAGLYDQDGQLIVIDNESECLIYSEDIILSLSGNNKVRA